MTEYPNTPRRGASARTLRRAPRAPVKLPQNTLPHVLIVPPSLIEHRPTITLIAKQTETHGSSDEFDVEVSAHRDAVEILQGGDRVRIKFTLRHTPKGEEMRIAFSPGDPLRESYNARQYLADMRALEKKMLRALAQWREDADTFGYDGEMP